MPKPIKDMTHPELIAHSREIAAGYDARALEHEAKSEMDEAAKLREWARRSREEADQQETWAAMRPASPSNLNTVGPGGWRWFAGDNSETYRVGPHMSRQDALDEAAALWLGVAIHLIEARQDPIDLAGRINVDSMVEQLHEALGNDFGGEDGESPAEDAWNDTQHIDLETTIEAAVRAWQARHRIIVTPRTFTASRNAERIETPGAEIPVAAE